jgi:hypothetical protein
MRTGVQESEFRIQKGALNADNIARESLVSQSSSLSIWRWSVKKRRKIEFENEHHWGAKPYWYRGEPVRRRRADTFSASPPDVCSSSREMI